MEINGKPRTRPDLSPRGRNTGTHGMGTKVQDVIRIKVSKTSNVGINVILRRVRVTIFTGKKQ
jgi:hypothetical protein